MNYEQAIAFLEGFIDYEKVRAGLRYDTEHFHLERFANFLRHLGEPRRKLKVVHLAGTKGKGSTAAILHSILTAAGVRAGLYTSPHLTSYRERVRIDGESLAPAAFGAAMEVVRRGVETFPHAAERNFRTAFELLTACALVAFTQAEVEWAVVETGLGGRLDATNVLEAEIAAITAIGRDHAEILGDSLEAIAGEKCGIIKPGQAVVVGPQTDEARGIVERVARQVCAERGATPHFADREWAIAARQREGAFQRIELEHAATGRRETHRLPLLGAHQAENLLTARCLVERLRERGLDIGEEALAEGVARVRWPGRFEVLAEEPLVVLDGAHCELSLRGLAATLAECHTSRNAVFVLGLMAGKAPAAVFAPLFERYPRAAAVAAPLPSPRALDPRELAAALAAAFPEASVAAAESVEDAVRQAVGRLPEGGALVVCGSLYHLEPARAACRKYLL